MSPVTASLLIPGRRMPLTLRLPALRAPDGCNSQQHVRMFGTPFAAGGALFPRHAIFGQLRAHTCNGIAQQWP